MAAGIAAVTRDLTVSTSNSRTISITHAGGGPLIVFVGWRQTSDVSISSVTYDGAALTNVVNSGWVNPSQGAIYRIDDPGAKTADLVITWGANILATCIATCRGTGVNSTGYTDSSGATTPAASASVDITYSRVSSDTISLQYNFRHTGTNVHTCAPDDGQTEQFDEHIDIGIQHAFYTLVESSSGSLTRSSTWSGAAPTVINGVVGISLAAAASGQSAVKRMGGVPFTSPNRGVW